MFVYALFTYISKSSNIEVALIQFLEDKQNKFNNWFLIDQLQLDQNEMDSFTMVPSRNCEKPFCIQSRKIKNFGFSSTRVLKQKFHLRWLSLKESLSFDYDVCFEDHILRVIKATDLLNLNGYCKENKVFDCTCTFLCTAYQNYFIN